MPLDFKDETWTRGTHICFRNLGKMNASRVTNVYDVLSLDNVLLGTIRWYGAWRKYCFYPEAETLYEETCLSEVAEFIKTETLKHRAKAKAARA